MSTPVTRPPDPAIEDASAAEHAEREAEAPRTDEGHSLGDQRRCGFVAIIGAPNAGKSTLVNRLVGTKVTIVSHKVQTTRMPIRGIVVDGPSQLVLIDTPGIFRPRRRLDRAMVDAAWGNAGGADIVVVLVDAAKGMDEEVERIADQVAAVPIPRLLALNKIDRVDPKSRLLDLATRITSRVAFDEVFMISALDGGGVDALRRRLSALVPTGPWHYGADDITDAPQRLFAAEITREKLYNRLHQELPYSSTVETTSWQERKDGSVRIEQTIFIGRENHKSIVLGKDGRTIKQISQESRHELAQILERTVHLFLHVKVKENWERDPERYREIGLDFPRDES